MRNRIKGRIAGVILRYEMKQDVRSIRKQAGGEYADRVVELVNVTASRSGVTSEWLWDRQFAGRDFTLTITSLPDGGERIGVDFHE